MATRKRKGAPNKGGLVLAMVLALAAVGGLAAYVKFTPADKVPPSERRADENTRPAPSVTVENIRPKSHPVDTERSDSDVHVYLPYASGERVSFRAVKADVAEDSDPKVYVVNRFLSSSHITDPKARLLSVDVRRGTADLYFNEAFGQTLGTDDEATVLQGLRTNLGQFPGVERVQLYVDGKALSTLGNVDLTEPMTVIKSGPQAHEK